MSSGCLQTLYVEQTYMAWTPRDGEIDLIYDPIQRALYKKGKPSEYDRWKWPPSRRIGRNRGGCFPEVVARAHFERSGYKVLLSDPKFPKGLGFILFHYRQRRRSRDKAFQRMQDYFPEVDLNVLAERARAAKLNRCRSGGGGDPDLFVFHPVSRERFFIEVKDEDELHCNQLVCFPIIEECLCPVKVARIRPANPRKIR